MAADSAVPGPQPSTAISQLSADNSPHTDRNTSQKSLEETGISNDALADVEKGAPGEAAGDSEDRNYLVEFDGPDDPGNPKNWTTKKRWAITVCMGLLVFTVTFASSIFSVNIRVVQEKFDVTMVTATLGVALFVLVSSSARVLIAKS